MYLCDRSREVRKFVSCARMNLIFRVLRQDTILNSYPFISTWESLFARPIFPTHSPFFIRQLLPKADVSRPA